MVNDPGRRLVPDRPSARAKPPGEVQVVGVHPEITAEAANGVERLPADEDECGERPWHLPRALGIPVALKAQALAEAPAEPLEPQVVGGGDQEGRERIDGVLRGPVREHEAGRDYRRLGVPLRRLEERLEGSRRQLDVLVGGGEPLAARSVGSQVGRLRKAEVLGRRHQVHPRELALDHLRRAVCRGVVDYPCLREPCVHLRLDRAEACRQEIVRVRVHDRDGDRGFAHAVSLGALESRSRRRIRGSDAGTLAAR